MPVQLPYSPRVDGTRAYREIFVSVAIPCALCHDRSRSCSCVIRRRVSCGLPPRESDRIMNFFTALREVPRYRHLGAG